MVRRRAPTAALAAALVLAGAGPAVADRPMGTVSTWSHELNQNELPRWVSGQRKLLVPAPRWHRIVDGIMRESGRSGLWFSGVSALPFPPLPLPEIEPDGWRTHRRFLRLYRATGLKWDVNVEVWPARNLLMRKRAVVADPTTLVWTRRMSVLDPAYQRETLREIRRIVPTVRNAPYVNMYTGVDEPAAVLPRGPRARRTPFARRLAADFLRDTGFRLPDPAARRSTGQFERLRYLAWSRWSSDRYWRSKARQARLIRRLDPDAVVNPADFGFVEGFNPWDYTRLAAFADVVEADPYVSYAERARTGRGRYNPGFGAKLLSDLTGKRTRIIVQGFEYSGYTPVAADLWTWTAQALRSGATDISFFAKYNPRFDDLPFYRGMLDVSRALRGARLPDPPTDPAQLIVYSTASEGQAQPDQRGGIRPRATGDAIYTAYSLLGELNGARFSFDADTRLAADPSRLARARTLWLTNADTLDRPFAEAVAAWVRAGGTLIVTDPEAFTMAPDGSSLAPLRDELIGAPLGPERTGSILEVQPGAMGAGTPDDLLTVPLSTTGAHAFAAVPAGASVIARYIDGEPGVILHGVGAGRVLAFGGDPMVPSALDDPMDLARLARIVHAWAGGTLDDPAWRYRIPGDPSPERLPWADAVTPAQARTGS